MCTEEDTDILQEIPDEDLPVFRDLFKKNWPYTMHLYYFIDCNISLKRKNISSIKFYCPNGKWNDGTFISLEPDDSFMRSSFFTFEENCERLLNALKQTNKINWDKQVEFCILHEAMFPIIYKEIRERKLKITSFSDSNLWWLPKEECLKFECKIPSEVYLAPLTEANIPLIDSIWPHRWETSFIYLSNLLKGGGAFGLYSKTDNSLCAWIMRNFFGSLAILQTCEEHKKKGYATVLTKYASKYWAEKGIDSFCFIVINNTASQNLFTKLNFRKEYEVKWVIVN